MSGSTYKNDQHHFDGDFCVEILSYNKSTKSLTDELSLFANPA